MAAKQFEFMARNVPCGPAGGPKHFSGWLDVAQEGPEVNSGMACGFMFRHTIAPDTLPEI